MDQCPEHTAYHARLSYLPPSVNKLYSRGRWGSNVLSKEGKKFKDKARLDLGQLWAFNKPMQPNKAHRLSITFYFPNLYNSGWPKTAKFRYKKRDVSNYVKLVEDIVSLATGVDDSTNISVYVEKQEGGPAIQITYEETDD